MAGDPRETWQRLQNTLQQRGRAGFGPGFGGSPRRAFGGAGALILLGVGGYIISNSLFNGEYGRSIRVPLDTRASADLIRSFPVDGGHRAIKYTRVSGVKKDIYTEGDYIAILNLAYTN
jgi:prohibitin 2